jgi:reactive chlorine resistance protein C
MNLRDLSGDSVVDAGLRWTIVFIFAIFGTAKFAAYEAAGVAMIAGQHPLFGWMYPLLGERGVSGVIGAIELVTGAVIALGAWSARASLVGGAMGVFTFLTTLSFSFGAAEFWQKGYGPPFLGSTGQFLVKDAVLLAACFAIAVSGLRRLQRSEETQGTARGWSV